MLSSEFLKAGLEQSLKTFVNQVIACKENTNNQATAFRSIVFEDDESDIMTSDIVGLCNGNRTQCIEGLQSIDPSTQDDSCTVAGSSVIADLFQDVFNSGTCFSANGTDTCNNFTDTNETSSDIERRFAVNTDKASIVNVMSRVRFGSQSISQDFAPCNVPQCEIQDSIMADLFDHFGIFYDPTRHVCDVDGINCHINGLVRTWRIGESNCM